MRFLIMFGALPMKSWLRAEEANSGMVEINKSQHYTANGRRTPFPWLFRRHHSRVDAVLSDMRKISSLASLFIELYSVMNVPKIMKVI